MRASVYAIGLGVLLAAGGAGAQVDAQLLARALGQRLTVPQAFRAGPANEVVGLVELPNEAAVPPGLVTVAPGFAAFRGSLQTFGALAAAHPDWRVTWAPPRRPQLDIANATTRAALFRNLTGFTGKGVVVGIVDTGFDPRHPDLRDETGKSRVAWTLDLSRQPVGRHPDLEATYGCMNDGAPCSILSNADLDELIAADSALLPRDTLGHGTHVASLAGGNGLSDDPPRYVGIAPEATLIAARVTRSGTGSILDPDVLLATRFIFDRAAELGLPAVVNLSLGSDFGGHDGRAPLELALAEFVGPEHPGRAMVVAAGNSGGVYPAPSADYPSPLGIHTEVHVPRQSSVRVPLLTPFVGASSARGTIYVWIAGRPGDELKVGLDDADGEWIEPLPPGEGATYSKGALEGTIVNQTFGVGSPLSEGSNGAVVVIDGTFASGETFAVRLEGRGSARLWVQSDGDLLPGSSSTGALFSRATKEGTIGIPASSPELIAVGATINRVAWTPRNAAAIKLKSFGALNPPIADSTAYFSGAGPNVLGGIKPDIVAPGAFVVAAMSSLTDPTTNGGTGIFAGGSVCGEQAGCLVVDDRHAISSGTSMAAPIVSGAVALLLEKNPLLTQPELLTLLQAGAKALDGTVLLEQQAGPGELDLVGTLSVLEAATTPLQVEPAASQSWLSLAESYVHPDPSWPLEGILQLRSTDDSIADGFDSARLRMTVTGGELKSPLVRVAPGMWRFAVTAPAGSGGGTLELQVRYGGQVFLSRAVPIAVDRWVAEGGVEARGGCAVESRPTPGRGMPWLLLLFVSIVRRRRRSCPLPARTTWSWSCLWASSQRAERSGQAQSLAK